MKKWLFAIKDTKVDFHDPFTSINKKGTLVDIQRAVNEGKIPYFEDKELWLIGEWNSENGMIESQTSFVCSLSSLKSPIQEEKVNKDGEK